MHIPVLVDEVLRFLGPKSNENFIDCTAGGGGHTKKILEKIKPEGKVLAFEWDKDLYTRLKEEKNERLLLVNESYTRLEEIVEEKKFFAVSGILFDLGFSSFHVDESKRGFSFMRDERLDMRYSKDSLLTAKDIVNKQKEKDLLYILKNYGEEEYAEDIARAIVIGRKEKEIVSTKDMVNIIEKVVPEEYKKKKINCATKTFQAIRIAVNAEILGIQSALLQALNVLDTEGRIVIICFHGGEEKVVKEFARKNNVEVVTQNPVRPTEEEINKNIRSRSAKLYALIKK